MPLVNEVIDNIRTYGNSQVYIRKINALKYSVINFQIIDGYLTIVSDQHFFDKIIWDGNRINKKAKEVKVKRIFQYSANPKIVKELDPNGAFNNRLLAIMALLIAHSLNPKDADVECIDKPTKANLESYNWASFLSDIVVRGCEISYQDLTHFVDLDTLDIASILKSRLEESEDIVHYPYYSPVVMSELCMDTFIQKYDEVRKTDHIIKTTKNEMEFEKAINDWKSWSYSIDPIVFLPKEEKTKRRR